MLLLFVLFFVFDAFFTTDRRKLPNFPYIHEIDDSLDERTSFFQHVTINVTWEPPQGTRDTYEFYTSSL